MKRLGVVILGVALSTGACGGGGSSSGDAAGGGDGGGNGDGGGCYAQPTDGFNCAMNGGDDCVVYPTEKMMAVAADDSLVEADFSCAIETPSTFAAAATVSGRVYNFQDGMDVADATVSVFEDFNFEGEPIAATTGDGEGAYSLTIPAGTSNRTHWLMEQEDALPTIGLFIGLDTTQTTITGSDRGSVSELTANALPAFIGHARTPGLGVVAGSIEDCQGRPVVHAIGVMSSVSSADGTATAPVDDAEVYFFTNGLPARRNMRNDSNTDGRFVAIEAPVASQVYLQAWGYTSDEDACTGPTALKLLSELPSPVIGDTVISASMYPNQGAL